MLYIKKLIFVPLFLGVLAVTFYLLEPVLKSTDIILGLSLNSYLTTLYIAGGLILSSLFFALFVTFSQDWKEILLASAIAGILPIVLISGTLGYVYSIGIVAILFLEGVLLINKLQSYVNFSASTLLAPTIKTLVFFMILLISFGYYLTLNENIKRDGFQIPDKVLDSITNFGMSSIAPKDPVEVKGVKYLAQAPQITREQLEELKKHPELLQQYGLTPADLDRFFPSENQQSGNQQSQPAASSSTTGSPKPGTSSAPRASTKPSPLGETQTNPSFVQLPLSLDPKVLIKSELEKMIKPYENFLAPFFALMLLSMLVSSAWVLQLFLNPLLWFLFYIFTKTKFIRFIKEQREVKKMIV